MYMAWYAGTYSCSDCHHLPPLALNVQQSHDGGTGPNVRWLHACFNSLTCTSRGTYHPHGQLCTYNCKTQLTREIKIVCLKFMVMVQYGRLTVAEWDMGLE